MLPNWGFRSNKRIHKSENTLELATKDGETIKFGEIVDNVKSANPKEKLWLHPLLFNGNLQTMYYAANNGSDKFKIWYGREKFTYKDEGICSWDWVIDEPTSEEEFKLEYKKTLPENWPRLTPRTRFLNPEELKIKQTVDTKSEKPIVVVFHGLGGGSHELLIRNLAHLLTTGDQKDKYDMVVINARGCCRTKITTGKLFHALATGDVEEAAIELKTRFPNRPLIAVGFSFGAVILANYLGKHPNSKLFKAASLVGCPFDLVQSAKGMEASWGGTYLFNPSLVGFLNKIIKNNLEELRSHNPELLNEENVNKARNATKTYEFDQVFTCKTAGFDNVWDYYKTGSPQNYLQEISIPTLAVSSKDDPSCKSIPFDKFTANPNIALVETDLGGHLAFVTPKKEFWCAHVVQEFISSFDNIV